MRYTVAILFQPADDTKPQMTIGRTVDSVGRGEDWLSRKCRKIRHSGGKVIETDGPYTH